MADSGGRRDAAFRDAGEGPVRLMARDAEDLQVVAALLQDAVLTGADMAWDRKRRRFDMLVGRFRWEHGTAEPERVRCILSVLDVVGVASDGVGRDADTVLSLLSIAWAGSGAPEDPSGDLVLTLAGDGALKLSVEALEVQVRDVTRPYAAPSGKAPDHGD